MLAQSVNAVLAHYKGRKFLGVPFIVAVTLKEAPFKFRVWPSIHSDFPYWFALEDYRHYVGLPDGQESKRLWADCSSLSLEDESKGYKLQWPNGEEAEFRGCYSNEVLRVKSKDGQNTFPLQVLRWELLKLGSCVSLLPPALTERLKRLELLWEAIRSTVTLIQQRPTERRIPGVEELVTIIPAAPSRADHTLPPLIAPPVLKTPPLPPATTAATTTNTMPPPPPRPPIKRPTIIKSVSLAPATPTPSNLKSKNDSKEPIPLPILPANNNSNNNNTIPGSPPTPLPRPPSNTSTNFVALLRASRLLLPLRTQQTYGQLSSLRQSMSYTPCLCPLCHQPPVPIAPTPTPTTTATATPAIDNTSGSSKTLPIDLTLL